MKTTNRVTQLTFLRWQLSHAAVEKSAIHLDVAALLKSLLKEQRGICFVQSPSVVTTHNNPEAFAQKMRILGKYHARGIHTWADGKCDFHPLLVCSCGNCENEEELKYEGKQCKSQKVLIYELHSLAYETECCVRAENADEIVDPDLGRGHSNLCEATFSVLSKFRAKDTNLHRLQPDIYQLWICPVTDDIPIPEEGKQVSLDARSIQLIGSARAGGFERSCKLIVIIQSLSPCIVSGLQ